MGKLNGQQWRVVIASFLGWALDAFDFFILVFTLPAIAATFGVKVPDVAYAIFLTLATRFVGAFIFGRLGDKYGRKPILMLDIVLYSVLGATAAFAPTLAAFLALRALFGVAMGGEWGLGSSLAMESIPPQSRGFVSGILQCGYPTGFLLASVVFGLFYNAHLFGYVIDWRGMFLFSLLPALLVLFIRGAVPESAAFEEAAKSGVDKPGFIASLSANWGLSIYLIVLMLAFNLFSHGTQDLYPVFLEKQHKFDHGTVSWVLIVANLGAIAGGLAFGAWSEKIGRANAITIAALIALPAIPLWAYGSSAGVLALGAFIMQVGVQGAWGVVPAHLNELVPGPVRATLPGLVYQIGNFLASYNAPFQSKLAEAPGNTYGFALAIVAGLVAVLLAIFIRFTPEKRGEAISVTT
ncbi:MAG: MFS transporter [Hyphomicrobiales bacterium]|nr:MFS transporter [Hyphomicrobiales bacterium]MDE2016109.1 MFS transporter [Hyphomicrobiales bacterium]